MLGEQELRRLQRDEGAWSSGVYTPGSGRETKIRGTWRPMGMAQVQLLESGDRLRDPRTLYTRTRLHPTNQHDNQPPDLVSPDGGATYYEVVAEFDGEDGAPGFSLCVRHWKYSLLRVQEEDG